jgi:hypothetical protein
MGLNVSNTGNDDDDDDFDGDLKEFPNPLSLDSVPPDNDLFEARDK